MKTRRPLIPAGWLCAACLCANFFAAAAEHAVSAGGKQEIESASQVFDRMFPTGLTLPQRTFVNAALKGAYGFAVIPHMTKVGFGTAQIQGQGLLVYRDGNDQWRPPLPLLVSGSSVGPHFGLISFDTLAVIRTPEGVQRLLSGKVMLAGKEITGPLHEAHSDNSDIVAYTRSSGFSAGCSQDDIHIDLDTRTFAAMYGTDAQPKAFFEGKFDPCRRPLPAQKLLENANVRSGGAPLTTIWTTPQPPSP
jgi:lipid-binding SYLF domain-containing protein